MSRDIEDYESTYLENYKFEAIMVAYGQRMLLERLRIHAPETVVEIGCGADLLYRRYIECSDDVKKWIIVEPAPKFLESARSAKLRNLVVIEGVFEEAGENIRSILPTAPDMIICSSVLHEVPDAGRLLASAVSIMGIRTVLHINVPNAYSFHRRLARSMGLIANLEDLSQRNRQLLQNRVYSRDSLVRDITEAGLSVIADGGYFIKPFTHEQMTDITGSLGRSVLDGLDAMGRENPEFASEIFVDVCKAARLTCSPKEIVR